MTSGSVITIASRVLARDAVAIARAISLVEDGSPGGREVLKELNRHAGRARIIGVTGAPGAGKSTLVDALAAAYRAAGCRVGIIAVDPTSAFSGGAVLGDRIRMQRHASDPDVFIRSMATRGHFGGLSRAASDAADILDAAGFDTILVETVGVGQDEVEIVRAADCVLVVLVPGLGDDIQAIKAGILEIADVYVLNKADREGVERLETEITTALSLAEERDRPRPEIIRTIAIQGAGVEAVIGAVDRHRAASESTDAAEERRRARSRWRLLELVRERILAWAKEDTEGEGTLEAMADRVSRREIDPHEAADVIVAAFAARSGRGAL